MFKKVLVVEDLDTISLTVVHALQELGVADVRYVKYCDDAYLKIKRAILDEEPFDLLISDLSFKTDHRENKLTSGEELIEAVKKDQPEIKTIIFSIEDKSFRIKSLFNKLDINAYVLKGRDSIPELKKTIKRIYADDKKIISDISVECRFGAYAGYAGLSVLHYMSLSLPVIVHSSLTMHMGPEPYSVIDGYNGFNFKRLDVVSLISAINKSFELDIKRYRDISSNAYITYENKVKPFSYSDRLIEALK